MEELQLTDKPSVTFSAATSPPRVTEEPSVQVPVSENGEELMVSGPDTVAGARVGPDGAAVVVDVVVVDDVLVVEVGAATVAAFFFFGASSSSAHPIRRKYEPATKTGASLNLFRSFKSITCRRPHTN